MKRLLPVKVSTNFEYRRNRAAKLQPSANPLPNLLCDHSVRQTAHRIAAVASPPGRTWKLPARRNAGLLTGSHWPDVALAGGVNPGADPHE